jgi:putative glutamine amidotransferase
MSPAPVIGITSGRGKVDGNATIRLGEAYVNAVLKAGGLPLLLPVSELPVEAVLPHLDGLLFTGGGDINPVRFNGVPHPGVYGVDDLRDEMEIALVHAAVNSGLPFLAICRGIQVVNVALGGTLYTHISDQLPGALHHEFDEDRPRDYLAHPVKVEDGSLLAKLLGGTRPCTPSPLLVSRSVTGVPKRYGCSETSQIMVNSLHHQGIQQVAAGLRPVAVAEDSLVEAVELRGHPFGLAVQWHPEALLRLEAMQALFCGLVKASSHPGT